MNKESLQSYLKNLQKTIISSFETLEPEQKFTLTPWKHQEGGGGIMGLLRGDIFEKAAVHFSAVSGEKFPLPGFEGPFFATGVSLITHMSNPHAPTVHMNIRFIETNKLSWFGGGYDLTPMGFFYEEDRVFFHETAKKALDPYGSGLYEDFSLRAKEYFYIPHRKKERGAGGIFFDHYHTEDPGNDLKMWKSVGESLVPAILPIYRRRIHEPYSKADKSVQNKMRSHYVEFNLLYDRGTKFGLASSGNTEAILSSLPPQASW